MALQTMRGGNGSGDRSVGTAHPHGDRTAHSRLEPRPIKSPAISRELFTKGSGVGVPRRSRVRPRPQSTPRKLLIEIERDPYHTGLVRGSSSRPGRSSRLPRSPRLGSNGRDRTSGGQPVSGGRYYLANLRPLPTRGVNVLEGRRSKAKEGTLARKLKSISYAIAPRNAGLVLTEIARLHHVSHSPLVDYARSGSQLKGKARFSIKLCIRLATRCDMG
jgi:hypothetical protein